MSQRARQKETLSIHIVCTGNIYRSRLAEAYLKAKQIPSLSFFQRNRSNYRIKRKWTD